MENKLLVIKAQIQVSRTSPEVYEAIVDPAKMSQYFIAKGSGRMEADQTLEWQFRESDTKVPVRVGELKEHEYISFYWDDEGKQTLVEISLITKGDATHVIITEKGKAASEAGIAWYGRNTEGWANFLACLKAYLEYGINLRKGAFDFMKENQ